MASCQGPAARASMDKKTLKKKKTLRKCGVGGGGVIRGYGTLIGLAPRCARVGIGLRACSRDSAPPWALPVKYVPPAGGGGGGGGAMRQRKLG